MNAMKQTHLTIDYHYVHFCETCAIVDTEKFCVIVDTPSVKKTEPYAEIMQFSAQK